MLDAAWDLLLGSCCAGCGAAGRPWCRRCASGLAALTARAHPRPAVPSPTPPGLPPVWTVGAYAGPWREALLAFKERGRRGLAGPLGRALAPAVRLAAGGDPGVRCVPVPTHRAARAERGYDQVALLVRSAVAAGAPPPEPLLRWVRAGADQAGLDAGARRRNRHGALAARPCAGLTVVLVDDIVTTGATLAEAARALSAAGAHVRGAATVAATVRRSGQDPPRRAGRGIPSSVRMWTRHRGVVRVRAPVRSDPARTQTLRAQTLRAESAQAPTDDRPVVPPPGALPDEQDGAHPPIVVRGRHTAVSERFRQHVAEKLRGLEKFDHKIIRFDVESSTEANPRQSHARDRIEITCLSRGPVVRAEAAAQDPYAALDCAVAKLEERLRRSADRRHSRGARIARVPRQRPDALGVVPDLAHELDPPQPEAPVEGVLEGDEDGPFVVREKVHPATPMTLDEALASMELVGHDFYLFTDSACGTASVVYRRRGYHYGVLRLNGEAERAG